jgi:hypothetical protein
VTWLAATCVAVFVTDVFTRKRDNRTGNPTSPKKAFSMPPAHPLGSIPPLELFSAAPSPSARTVSRRNGAHLGATALTPFERPPRTLPACPHKNLEECKTTVAKNRRGTSDKRGVRVLREIQFFQFSCCSVLYNSADGGLPEAGAQPGPQTPYREKTARKGE